MGLSIGIVGLPNVGKSTLFNALASASAPAESYPFCTIEPNVGVVPVPDERLDKLAAFLRRPKVIATTLEFVDIAGLVRGASKGEGLGNQFLANIREVDAILHVLRCFEDSDVTHVEGAVDPERDKEIADTELCLKDLETVEKRREKTVRAAKAPGKPGDEAKAELALLDKVKAGLDEGLRVRAQPLSHEERAALRELFLLTGKPVLYVANVGEAQLGKEGSDPRVQAVRELARAEQAEAVTIAAELEAEIQQLPPADRADYLKSEGLDEPGLNKVVRAGYRLLGLHTFFTYNEEELRAWTFHEGWKAPQCAGVIHTDFERGFIKVDVVRWDELLREGSEVAVRERGHLKIEGKDYVVRDGDILKFRFNV